MRFLGAWLGGVARVVLTPTRTTRPQLHKIQRRNAIKPKCTADPRVRDVQIIQGGSERGGLSRVHIRTWSRRRKSERLPQARERLGLAHGLGPGAVGVPGRRAIARVPGAVERVAR